MSKSKDPKDLDEIQGVKDRFWISEPFVLKDYFAKLKREWDNLKTNEVTPNTTITKKISDTLDFPFEFVQELESKTRLDLLTNVDDMPPINRNTALMLQEDYHIAQLPHHARQFPDGSIENFRSVYYRANDTSRKTGDKNKLKYEVYGCPKAITKAPKKPLINNDEDVILVVRIHRPSDKEYIQEKTKWFFPKCDQQFLLLGRQSLADLRDHIVCPKDAEPLQVTGIPQNGNVSCAEASGGSSTAETGEDTLTVTPSTVPSTAGKLFKSSYFFIENCFYVDSRESTMSDLSYLLRKQAELEGISNLKKEAMENIKFIDLTIRFGRPYLFVHQGNCEHLMVFADGRLAQENDPQDVQSYPMLVYVSTMKPILCMVCKKFTAKWVTTSNMYVTEDPFYFCDTCFYEFNYDETGKKKGRFEAYPYIDRNNVL